MVDQFANKPRRHTDRFILNAFSASMSPIRAWLLMKGYPEAASALRDITYDDAQDAFEMLREEASEPRLTDQRAKEILSTLEGGPRPVGSILPTLAEAREATVPPPTTLKDT